ncbi:MAG: DNA repair protein [Chloroflexi bacterium]|nr:DNA repair protein [Chloroflexota bacterium]
MPKTPELLPFTDLPEADRLIAQNPLALLIGFELDQQVTLQKAFSGPWDIKQRLGHLDAARIAAYDPEQLADVFRQRPAIHRFPGSMAGKVQQLCAEIAKTYGGDASRIWTEAKDAKDLRDRLMALPGFGEMKVRTVIALLSKQFGVELPGLAAILPNHQTLGDADSYEKVAEYQTAKRAHKAELRAAGKRA